MLLGAAFGGGAMKAEKWRIDWEAVRGASRNSFTRAEAEAVGMDRHLLLRRCRSGELVEVVPSVYLNSPAPPSLPTMLHAVTAFFEGRNVFSGETAGWFHQLDGCRFPAIHVTLQRGERLSREIDSIQMHSSRRLQPEDVCWVAGLPVLTVPATIVDLSLSENRRQFVAAYQTNFRRSRKHRAVLKEYVATRCNGLDVSALVELMKRHPDDAPPTESYAESVFEDILWRHGLTPTRQVSLYTPNGVFLGRVDFAFPSLRIALEVDGRRYHERDPRFRADRARDRRMKAALDYDVLRYTMSDFDDEEALINEIKTVMHRRARQLYPNAYSALMPKTQMSFPF